MFENRWGPVSALEGIAASGRYGRRTGDVGMLVSEVAGAGLASVMTRSGRRQALAAAVRSAFAAELPAAPRREDGGAIAFIWSGPDQWLALTEVRPAKGMEALLAAPLAGLASIVDKSHGLTLLRLAGPRIRDALAKGIAVDLNPRIFNSGCTAITAVAHIGVQFWQLDDRPTYEFAVPRGYVGSYWHWLAASAAEYGVELIRPSATGALRSA